MQLMEFMKVGELVLVARFQVKVSIHSQLGIEPIVNGVGPATRLGGLALSENVWKAMRESNEHSYRMEELHESAGKLIANLIGAPSSLVTAGASAALTLSTAACIAGFDRQMLIDLPFPQTKRVDVLVQRVHQDPYDHALSAAGARMRPFGDAKGTTERELIESIDEKVCALLWRESTDKGALDLATCSKIAHEHGIPVIVDGALFIPPLNRLKNYLEQGADFVAISGGKGFRGPHTSGLLVASPANIRIAMLHHIDLDERNATWSHQISEGEFAELPSNGIGRSMKVGREQIFGLIAAIQEYLITESYQIGDSEITECKSVLDQANRVQTEKVLYSPLNVTNLHIHVPSGFSADEFYMKLATGRPRIILGQEMSDRSVLTLNPMSLMKGQGFLIGTRINEITIQGKGE
jgi:D-glucosaminate-6-phosphate ammonia-lyase